jgi:hypothetical protein
VWNHQKSDDYTDTLYEAASSVPKGNNCLKIASQHALSGILSAGRECFASKMDDAGAVIYVFVVLCLSDRKKFIIVTEPPEYAQL